MIKTLDYIINPRQQVVRYDLQQPPMTWDQEYHSCEYTLNENEEIVHKNQSGLLFFYDSESTTIKTAEQAMKSHDKTEFWLTAAFVNNPIRLLDLRGGATLVIFNNLFVNGIDVFNSPLSLTGLPESAPLKSLEPLYYHLMQNVIGGEEYNYKWLRLHEPFIYPGSPYSLLGQRLTDFENGEVFKSLLLAHNYDGYIFDESYGGSTICLINSNHLSNPMKEKFDAKRLLEWNKQYYRSRYNITSLN